MKPFDQLQVVEHLEKDCEYIYKNVLEYIPKKYHTTSLSIEATCSLSYHTGRRDMIVQIMRKLESMNVQLTAEGEDVLEDMYKKSKEQA